MRVNFLKVLSIEQDEAEVIHCFIIVDSRANRNFTDQFAFRPSGSTSAALISITHELQSMLESEPYVRLLSLDFSKAFDTVRHKHLADQLAAQPIPDFFVQLDTCSLARASALY